MEDPLLDIAISYAQDCHKTINSNEAKELYRVFDGFLKNQISKSEASAIVEGIVGSSNSVEKIDAILNVPDEPIPFSPTEPSFRSKSKPWTTSEDQRLLAAIHKMGLESWNNIALFVGNGRTRSQCSQRWNRGLNPKISKTCWSKEEEVRLISFVEKYGERSWTKIATEFGNRSDVQCRYRYQQLCKDSPYIDPDEIPEGPVSCPNAQDLIHSPHNLSIQKANSLTPNLDNIQSTSWKQPEANNSQRTSLFGIHDFIHLPPPIYQPSTLQQTPNPSSVQPTTTLPTQNSINANSPLNFAPSLPSNLSMIKSQSPKTSGFLVPPSQPIAQSQMPMRQSPQINMPMNHTPVPQTTQVSSPEPPKIDQPDIDLIAQRVPRMSLPQIDASFYIEY